MGSVAVEIAALVERWFSLVLQECFAIEQPTEAESQVAAVVWSAHGGSLIRAPQSTLVDCSHLDTTLFEGANPDAAFVVASWLRDLRNLRRTEYADLGEPSDRKLNVWMLGKIPVVENNNTMVTFSHNHQIQMSCQHLQLQNNNCHHTL